VLAATLISLSARQPRSLQEGSSGKG